MYSRYVLSRLLAYWPDDRALTSEILNSGDEVQLIGILDLLQRIERKEVFETVILTLMNLYRNNQTSSHRPSFWSRVHLYPAV